MKGGGATTENKRVTRDKMTKPRKAAAAEKRKGAAAAEKRKRAAAAVRHETAARETSVTAQLVTSQLQKNCAGNSTRAADSNNVHLSLPSMSALALMSNFVTTRLPKKCRGDRPNLRQNNKQKGFSCGDESGAGDATDAQRAKCSTRERERHNATIRLITRQAVRWSILVFHIHVHIGIQQSPRGCAVTNCSSMMQERHPIPADKRVEWE
jgi:hypothetical protein